MKHRGEIMSTNTTQSEWPSDPWEAYRDAGDAYLEIASKFMSSIVNSSEYAEATGDLLRASLDMAEPTRVWLDKLMPQILAMYQLPSRQEMNSVATRMTNIELKLDDISANLEELTESRAQSRR
jgi:hypothetical protein